MKRCRRLDLIIWREIERFASSDLIRSRKKEKERERLDPDSYRRARENLQRLGNETEREKEGSPL